MVKTPPTAPTPPEPPSVPEIPPQYVIQDWDDPDTVLWKEKMQILMETKTLELSAKYASMGLLFFKTPGPMNT